VRKNGITETSVGLLFKKPWSISPGFEFMASIGPKVIHATGAEHGNFWGLEAVSDFTSGQGVRVGVNSIPISFGFMPA